MKKISLLAVLAALVLSMIGCSGDQASPPAPAKSNQNRNQGNGD